MILLQDKIPLLILLSVGAASTSVWLILMRKRLNLRWYAAIPLAIFHTIYGVFTVKAFAFLETGFDKASLGNMSLFGGVFSCRWHTGWAQKSRSARCVKYSTFLLPV